jgi:hypothetical protein
VPYPMKSERETFERQPGAVPEIRVDGDSVIFYLDVSPGQSRLVIRCDPDGSVAAAIESRPRGDRLT